MIKELSSNASNNDPLIPSSLFIKYIPVNPGDLHTPVSSSAQSLFNAFFGHGDYETSH
ncbi:hypothetical protein Ljor_0201 [Legionella jordanis]|uniref:Uncharacterized protein n=1 Tax=Legionella jordanis TaxID=456 RepID=A0A0W0VFW7_9GAMM|nr:hypothetical protein Ljor_0201 [Legionella jordanis]VEH13079.1 Uncharacterised protein [Legionella jordanis]